MRKWQLVAVLGAVALGMTACAERDLRRDWSLTCTFFPPGDDPREVPGCARREKDRLVVSQVALLQMRFESNGLATAAIGSDFLYVDRGGKTAPVLPLDNGPDRFVEGVARTTRGGKVGFVDESLNEVVLANWDFAYPFENGVAVVCTGCVSEKHGEHSEIRGGKWGVIDHAGRVVVPVEYARDELDAHAANGSGR